MSEPVPHEPVSIAALTVLFNNSWESLRRSVAAFDNSVRIGREANLCSGFTLALGDASPAALLSEDRLEQLRALAPHIDLVHYEFFDENTGTSRGQNRLSRTTESDLIVLCNPDVVPDARAMWRMAALLDDQRIGIVEAKQLPIEHPKDYDEGTGLTSWCSGAFSMVRRALFEELEGFDEQTFFLYCDDVDLSWRIREAGYDAVMQPAAVVFHGKDLSASGGWVPTEAERYYSAEAALLLAHKWSRDVIVADLLEQFDSGVDENHRRAAEEFRRRQDEGVLVPQRDSSGAVGRFVDGQYAHHRYAL